MSSAFKTAISNIWQKIPDLNGENWSQFSKLMQAFFQSAGLTPYYVNNKTPPEDKQAEFATMDAQLGGYFMFKVAEEYQFLVEDKTSGLKAWKALKSHFERSTMGGRILARKEFYGVVHDPSQPIIIYFQALTAAKKKLESLGCKVEDMEFKDVLLMNLDDSFLGARTTILAQKVEPTIDEIKTMLRGATAATETSATHIKQEPISLAFAARRGRAPAQVPQSSNVVHGPIDSKGIRWCDPTADGCHRCGRPNHVAARCMFNMPQHIKDWLMAPRSRTPSPPPAHSNAAFVDQAYKSSLHFAGVASHFHKEWKDKPSPPDGGIEEEVLDPNDLNGFILYC